MAAEAPLAKAARKNSAADVRRNRHHGLAAQQVLAKSSLHGAVCKTNTGYPHIKSNIQRGKSHCSRCHDSREQLDERQAQFLARQVKSQRTKSAPVDRVRLTPFTETTSSTFLPTSTTTNTRPKTTGTTRTSSHTRPSSTFTNQQPKPSSTNTPTGNPSDPTSVFSPMASTSLLSLTSRPHTKYSSRTATPLNDYIDGYVDDIDAKMDTIALSAKSVVDLVSGVSSTRKKYFILIRHIQQSVKFDVASTVSSFVYRPMTRSSLHTCRALQQSAFDARVFAVAQPRLRSICSSSTGLAYTAHGTTQSLVKTTPGASQDYLFEDTIPAVYYYKNTSRPYVSENGSFINFVLDMSFAWGAVVSLSVNDFLSGAVNTNQYWRFLLTDGGFTADSFVLVLKYTELIWERAAYGQVVICWSL
ncbi:hypothetical protein SeMB42_g08018, partial [Synchytrium endobioticum]